LFCLFKSPTTPNTTNMKTNAEYNDDVKSDDKNTAYMWIAATKKSDCLRLQRNYESQGFKVLRKTRFSWLKMRYTAKLSKLLSRQNV